MTTLTALHLPEADGAIAPSAATNRQPLLDVTVPVYNEVHVLESSIRRLHGHLGAVFPGASTITIVDNASTDGTHALALRLARELPDVRVIHLAEKGRGRALRAAWSTSPAVVVAYMDVDLSTDLGALAPLVQPLLSGAFDVAIGSRLAPGASVARGWKRDTISRSYNGMLRLSLGLRVHDAQCGFKAMRAEVARVLLPQIENEAWFFDTELLVLAQRQGLHIHELAVTWVDDPDSRVHIIATALEDLRGIARLRAHPAGLAAFVLAVAVTTLSVNALAIADPQAGRPTEVLVLVSANLVASCLRFLALRESMERGRRASHGAARLHRRDAV